MINKMHALMREKRVEWELDWKDFTAAFMSIRTAVTGTPQCDLCQRSDKRIEPC